MIIFVAAINLLHLKRRIPDDTDGNSARWLQRTTLVELLLSIVVLAIVGIMGVLAPGR
jgi:putative copper export protein